MSNFNDYLLNDEQLDVVRLATESYKIYAGQFDKLSKERKDELLQVEFDIIKDGLNLDTYSTHIVQQLINFKISLHLMGGIFLGEDAKHVIDEEIQFIIRLVIEKYRIDNADN